MAYGVLAVAVAVAVVAVAVAVGRRSQDIGIRLAIGCLATPPSTPLRDLPPLPFERARDRPRRTPTPTRRRP